MRRSEENNEKTELVVGKRHGLPVTVQQAPRIQVQLPSVETVGTNALRPALLRLRPPAAQQGADPREQLPRAERLGQIIVGPQFQPITRSASSLRPVSMMIGIADSS